MKKLYLELFVLLVALLGSVFIIEKIYASYQTPPDSAMQVFNQRKQQANTVFIGNSHTVALGEPVMFNGKTFNLAFSGINLFDIVMLVKNVIARESHIRNVIIGLDYDIIGLNSSHSILSLQLYRYTDSLESGSIADYLKARSNYFRSGQDFWYLFAGSAKFSKENNRPNFIPLDFKSKQDKEGCTRRALEHGAISYKEDNVAKNTALLKELIEFGKSHHLNLVFVCTPKTSCYTSTYMSLPQVSSAKHHLDEIFKKCNLVYYDMMQAREFNDDDFVDFDHLNENGAAKLISVLQAAMHQAD